MNSCALVHNSWNLIYKDKEMIKTNFEDEIEELIKFIEENEDLVKAYDEKIRKLRRELPLCIVF